MEILSYLASLLIGTSLGLLGGGGSILMVPVLHYGFGLAMTDATTYSLLVVGIASAIGAASYLRARQVDLRRALAFGIPSIAAVLISRNWLLPAIPTTIATLPGMASSHGSITITRDLFLLLLFALLMVAAAWGMIHQAKPKAPTQPSANQPFSYPLTALLGTIVGTLTGLIGAGGGFLIIPALVVLARLPMKVAIGTSLTIIAANALLGFFVGTDLAKVDWLFLATISSLATIGIFVGERLARKVNGAKLKPAFGWFVLVVGTLILVRELLC